MLRWTPGTEDDDTIGIGEIGRFEENRIDDGKDGGVGTDAEGQSGDGGGGEPAALPEHAEGVAKVLQKGFHRGPSGYTSSEGLSFVRFF